MSLDVGQSDQLVKYLVKTNCGNGAEQKRCSDALIRLMADKAYTTKDERHKQILVPKNFPPLLQATHYLGVRNIVAATLFAYPEDAIAFLADVQNVVGDTKATNAFFTGCVVGTMEASGMVWHDLLKSETELAFDNALASFLVSFLSGEGKNAPALLKGDASIFSSAVAEYVGFPLSIDDSERHAPALRRCVGGLLKKLKPIRSIDYTNTRLGDQFLHEVSYKLMPDVSDGHRMNFVFGEYKVEFDPLPKYLGHE